ncbi:MAG: hypothetical protein Q3978_05525 [Limosilactobacillus gorillae]|nr:hypothetical protein [Limosilactobacillus gorillae]
MNFPNHEELSEGLATLISQLPPLILDMLDPELDHVQRQFRFHLFSILTSDRELTMDQVHSAALPEFLSLGMCLNPAAFDPSQDSPADMARQKASSFVFPYLMNRYLAGLRMINTPSTLMSEFEIDAGDLAIAQIQRLQYNYNANFKVANYLADLRARDGLVASLTARHATASTTKSPEVISLTGQIGQALAVAVHIIDECEGLSDPTVFQRQIVTGNYPLALLFTRESEAAWFDNFFHQLHRPSPEDFQQAATLAIKKGQAQALEIAGELLSQTRLDVQVLPDRPAKERLATFIKQVEDYIK